MAGILPWVLPTMDVILGRYFHSWDVSVGWFHYFPMLDAPKGLHIFMSSSGLRSDLRGRKDMKLVVLFNSYGKSLLLLVTSHWLFSSLRWGDTFNIKNNNFIFSVLFDLSSKVSVLVWGELGWKFSRAMWRFNLKWWFSYIVLKSNLWIKLPSQLHA